MAELEIEIAHLRTLDLDGLRARWRTIFGRQAPVHLARHFLRRILAYRVQAEALGDLDVATMRVLSRIAGSDARGDPSAPVPQQVRPGTMLVREWHGVNHRVLALDEGFAWNGGTFKSLSQVARAITGTRWNGLIFFGIKRQGSPA